MARTIENMVIEKYVTPLESFSNSVQRFYFLLFRTYKIGWTIDGGQMSAGRRGVAGGLNKRSLNELRTREFG